MGFRRTDVLRVVGVIGAFVLSLGTAADRNILPPEVRIFAAPGGAYQMEVRSLDGWRSPRARAQFFHLADSRKELLWAAELRQRYGPGTAVVNDAGNLLLIDEWVRVLSDDAVVLIDRSGAEIARHGVSDIAVVSGVSRADLAQRATVGPWMSAPPVLAPSGASVRVSAGGVALDIDLRSGEISRSP